MAKSRKKKYKMTPAKPSTGAREASAEGREAKEGEKATSSAAEKAKQSPQRKAKGTVAPSLAPTPEPRWWMVILALLIATVAAHGLCLMNPFYLDDQAHILKSPRIVKGEWYGSQGTDVGYRLIPYYLWWKFYVLAGNKFDPLPFHAANLIFHFLTVVAFYYTAREFTRLKELEPQLANSRHRFWIPFWGALLFAVHPLVTEPINYSAQTSILSVTLFAILATFFMLRWLNTGSWWLLILLGLSVILAAISKKPGLWHVLANLVILGAILWRTTFRHFKVKGPWRWVTAGLLVGMAGVAWRLADRMGIVFYVKRIFNDPQMETHILTQGRVFWAYISRMFVPKDLCSDHWMPVTVPHKDDFRLFGLSMADGEAIVGLLGIIILVLFSLSLYFRHRGFCLLLLLTLSHLLLRFAFRNNEPMVEYRCYPSMPWFSLLVAYFFAIVLGKRVQPLAFSAGAAIIVLISAGMSAARSYTWNDPHRIAENIIDQYPLHARCHSYIQAVDFSGGSRVQGLIRRTQNPAEIVKVNTKEDGQYHKALDRIIRKKDGDYDKIIAPLKEAEESLAKAKDPDEKAKLTKERDAKLREVLEKLKYQVIAGHLKKSKVGNYKAALNELDHAEERLKRASSRFKRERDSEQAAKLRRKRDAEDRKTASKKREAEVARQLETSINRMLEADAKLNQTKDPAQIENLKKQRDADYQQILAGLKKMQKESYQRVIDRQLVVREVMKDIFAYNKKHGPSSDNKSKRSARTPQRSYILARALNSFMFCEQYNGYALIALGRPEEAITRIDEVITVLKRAVKSDHSMSFAVLYRVRGQAYATIAAKIASKDQKKAIEYFTQAADDYRRCLVRFPHDLETPRLIQRLPQQFRARGQPGFEGATPDGS